MPFIPFFTDQNFDAETRRVLGVALELVSLALRIGDCDEDVKVSLTEWPTNTPGKGC
jgi:hypothetical protein